MKQLIAGLLAAFCINALAVNTSALLTPSPLGVVIAAHSYVTADRKKIYYIKVHSSGATFEQARQQGFRLATEQVAGVVILSETELKNYKLTRDEIVSYSSGVVDEYKILDRVNTGNGVELTMEVWIAESIIAQRLLASSATERGIDGDALATRVDSILDEQQRGDKLLKAVLRDLPSRSFNVKVKQANIYMDGYRSTKVVVPYELHWDDRYFNSINAALKELSKPRPWCWSNCAKAPAYSLNGYAFDDPQKLVMFVKHVQGADPYIRVQIKDIHDRVIVKQCQPVAIVSDGAGLMQPDNYMVYIGNNVVAMRDVYVRGSFEFNFGQNVIAIAKLDQIHAEVVTRTQC